MPPAVRRARALMAWLLMCLGLGTAFSIAPAQADDSGITVTGTISTPDGGPIDAVAIVRLQSVLTADDGGTYATPQDSAFLTPNGSSSRSFTLTAPTAGFYTISVQLQGTTTRYLPTWLSGSGSSPASMDDPGIFLIREGETTSAGHDLTLRQAQRINGVVRGTNGQPLADVTVKSLKWVDGRVESAGRDSLTGDDGRYSVAVPPGTEATLAVTGRSGYAPWLLGGQHTTQTAGNTLAATEDRTQDIELTPDWSGAGAMARDEFCLRHGISGTADLDGLRLDVDSKGLVVPTDAEVVGDPLDPASATPALVPYWSDTARRVTWGVEGDTLCAVWRSEVDGMAYQLQYSREGDLTLRYGAIGPNLYVATPRAGWTEGTTDDAVQVELPIGELQDRGVYRFTYTGFTDTSRPPAATSSGDATVTPAAPEVGDLLTATPGSWVTDERSRATLTYAYQWMRAWEPIPDAVGPTLQTSPDDEPGEYQVRVVARRPGHAPVLHDTVVTVAAATDDPDVTSPSPPTPGLPSGTGDGVAVDASPTASGPLPGTGGVPMAWLVADTFLIGGGLTLLRLATRSVTAPPAITRPTTTRGAVRQRRNPPRQRR